MKWIAFGALFYWFSLYCWADRIDHDHAGLGKKLYQEAHKRAVQP